MNTSSFDISSEFKVSPMMSQWQACKQAAGEAVLLFRLGDFYEAFDADAVLIAKELDLTLTKRGEIPMAGIPHHTSEAYIDRLVSKGFRVAVAEQIGDPKTTKGIVKREIVRVVTPGTVINSTLLSDKSNNFFASIHRVGEVFGLSFIDLTTSEFRVVEFENEQELLNEIFRLRPSECLVSHKFQSKHQDLLKNLRQAQDFLLTAQEDWRFEHQTAYNFLINHFGVHNLDGFGLRGMLAGINAAGAILNYLQDNLCLSIEHIQEVRTYSTSQFMSLDRITQRNLEITASLYDGSRKSTLLNILDKTCTPMGARLLLNWIKLPLLSIEEIKRRQDAIEAFFNNKAAIDLVKQLLGKVRDLERLMMKISSGYASPRDLVALKCSFEEFPQLKQALQRLAIYSTLLEQEEQKLENPSAMTDLIARALVDEPPLKISDGQVFREGYHNELDELRSIRQDSRAWLANYQTRLREETGIKTLKVGFTRMFGYYIEVSKGQSDRMPTTFQRRQTLVNGERYITSELKEFEQKVLNAEERILAIETGLFNALREEITKYTKQVFSIAQAIAKIDALRSLAEVALFYDYTRPIVDHSSILQIINGRHPVIEAINTGEKFVPNDTLMDNEANLLLLITGPNMAGKSTYIRQVALITIMAQIGSFVPAKSAHIGIVDKVFTRIGASDDLSRGQSTFMVEMTETANILNNATARSLVILDEIGRGTSTYDGISIAWSVAEYLLTTEGSQAKTLFATHYWELTKLEERVPGAVNYHVAVHEAEDVIVFLRKIVRGSTDKSYGIHVGRLAGLPLQVIGRAKEILAHLEENANQKSVFEPSKPKRQLPAKKNRFNESQMTFFG
ncbi:DNA mismatch repair protein MutS|uniref:DNA mismatch repair protein MutS n=1 Tax=Neochlamydia sp. AcF84 TaxID=2315858 RepID=UPI001408A7C7|nr:DNA mismatch repair protein MutS [Neochlamydia sp. AcF84]NGY94684.1 DNA mismatch repair protein MutS [Neochlamydia sp. AcF84]